LAGGAKRRNWGTRRQANGLAGSRLPQVKITTALSMLIYALLQDLKRSLLLWDRVKAMYTASNLILASMNLANDASADPLSEQAWKSGWLLDLSSLRYKLHLFLLCT